MGGHGGLNILPQKRWHLYRDDNRARVAKDEADARERERSAQRNEASARLDATLTRLRGDALTGDSLVDVSAAPVHAVSALAESATPALAVEATNPPVRRRRQRSPKPTVPSGLIGEPSGVPHSHVNLFWETEESDTVGRAAHDKYLKEVGHQASDAPAFPPSFFAAPWYARPSSAAEPNTASSLAHAATLKVVSVAESASKDTEVRKRKRKETEIRKHKRKHHRRRRRSSSPDSADLSSSTSTDSEVDERSQGRRRSTRKSSSKRKRRRAEESKPHVSKIEELRKQRVEREAAEQERQNRLFNG